MNKNMAVKVMDRLFIVAYGPGDPTDEEWIRYLRLIKQSGVDRMLQLVYMEGGAPTPAQRRLQSRIVGGRPVPTAVLSSSLGVRAIVTAMSLLNKRLRAFPQTPQGLREAVAYLEVPETRYDVIEPTLRLLVAEIHAGRSPLPRRTRSP